MRLTALCLAVFAFASLTVAQESQKRQVTVTTAEDKKYEGVFIKADAAGVTIETGDVQTIVKLDIVKSIVFGEPAQPTPTPDPAAVAAKASGEAAKRAVEALRKLKSATSVGVNFMEYGRILIDAKTSVDAELSSIQESELKTEIRSALYEYSTAAQIWNYFVRNPRATIPSKSDAGRTLINTYGVPVKISVFTGIGRDDALSAIWAKANRHFTYAERLASQ
jgi:hypothetical protein